MRILFVYYLYTDAGSAQDILGYASAARMLGHDVCVYGAPHFSTGQMTPRSKDVRSFDAGVFVFEWTTDLQYGDQLDLARLVGTIPRNRRIVIDCDGSYNELIRVLGDQNHRNAEGSQLWIDICESLSDKICQPTLHPLRENVRSFLFHGYDPMWEAELDLTRKEFCMVYVGHNKYRWAQMKRILNAVEPIRSKVGRIVLVGHGWDCLPWWAAPMQMEDAFISDPGYLTKLSVEVNDPIHFEKVIPQMSKALFTPVIYRPVFDKLQFVTCRTFETVAANTIPLFALDSNYVSEIYGPIATELVLGNDATLKIEDVFSRPERYLNIVRELRSHVRKAHCFEVRFKELLRIID